MIAGILQPSYLPWLGFFEQIHKSDVFVIYDDVQFDKGGWRNRNKIKNSTGAQWLTIPVHVSQGSIIRDIKIDNKKRWQDKHLKSMQQCYSMAPYFSNYFPDFEKILLKKWEFLIDLDMELINQMNKILGIERLIGILQLLSADTFYEGFSGRDYIDKEDFKKEGIEVVFQEYRHPVYQQQFGKFISHLSIIDLFFNCGPESLDIILNKKS